MDSIRLTFSTEVSAMYSLFIVAAAAFAAAFVLTPICRNLAIRWGMLDRPDHDRKIHPGPIRHPPPLLPQGRRHRARSPRPRLEASPGRRSGLCDRPPR